MHIWEHREKLSSLRTMVTLRHKPPCLLADPLECCQQVPSVISSVIIFGWSVQAEGQTTVPSHHKPFKLEAFFPPSKLHLSLWAAYCLFGWAIVCWLRNMIVFILCALTTQRGDGQRVNLEHNSSSARTSSPVEGADLKSNTLNRGHTNTFMSG